MINGGTLYWEILILKHVFLSINIIDFSQVQDTASSAPSVWRLHGRRSSRPGPTTPKPRVVSGTRFPQWLRLLDQAVHGLPGPLAGPLRLVEHRLVFLFHIMFYTMLMYFKVPFQNTERYNGICTRQVDTKYRQTARWSTCRKRVYRRPIGMWWSKPGTGAGTL